jgi:hypothetical protein
VIQSRDGTDEAPGSLVAAGRRRWEAIWAARPSGAPGYVLLGLLVTGVALRLIAIASWWPVTTTLDDGYETFAATNPFANTVHPAGYSLILAAIGALTREVAVTVVLQHLAGIASALLLWAATRRVSGSAWAGLFPAGIVLLGADQIFLEHSIMSETTGTLLTSVGLYAAVRAFDEARPWWRWPLLTGAALGVGVTIRTASLLLIPVAVLALLLYSPLPLRTWQRWEAALTSAVAAAAVLITFAGANAAFGDHFGIQSSPGWYLYGRAAEFADCTRFTPPRGSERLCEQIPAGQRQGPGWYWGLGFTSESRAPGPRFFGPFGNDDGLLGRWSERAILAQPLDYLASVWEYGRGYWYPFSRPKRPNSGSGLDPQLAFSGGYPIFQGAIVEAADENSLRTFYDGFTVHKYQPGLDFLRAWQRVIRFGPLALSAATLLTLLGLVLGTRRSRVAVLLFGVGGLTLLVPPALTANYAGRYTVPMAGVMVAAAAIAVTGLWDRRRLHARASESAR